MLCKYTYMTKKKQEVGEYQCDTDDLKNLLKSNPNIECLVAKLENGETWILYKRLTWQWAKVKMPTLS